MTQELWTASEIAAATGGRAHGDWAVVGVSIDSRTVQPRELFIALRGPHHDGHAFVADALARGAAALVERVPGWPERDGAGRGRRHHGRAHRARPRRARAQRRAHRRAHRQRRQDRHQGSVAPCALGAGAEPCQRREPQQPLGRAAQPRARAARHRVCRLRAGHECARRDRGAHPPRAAARRHGHGGRGGAPRLLPFGRGDRRGQGRDLLRAGAGRDRGAECGQSALRAPRGHGRGGRLRPRDRLRRGPGRDGAPARRATRRRGQRRADDPGWPRDRVSRRRARPALGRQRARAWSPAPRRWARTPR